MPSAAVPRADVSASPGADHRALRQFMHWALGGCLRRCLRRAGKTWARSTRTTAPSTLGCRWGESTVSQPCGRPNRETPGWAAEQQQTEARKPGVESGRNPTIAAAAVATTAARAITNAEQTLAFERLSADSVSLLTHESLHSGTARLRLWQIKLLKMIALYPPTDASVKARTIEVLQR